jgi:hypothetical protein
MTDLDQDADRLHQTLQRLNFEHDPSISSRLPLARSMLFRYGSLFRFGIGQINPQNSIPLATRWLPVGNLAAS